MVLMILSWSSQLNTHVWKENALHNDWDTENVVSVMEMTPVSNLTALHLNDDAPTAFHRKGIAA